MGNCNYFVFSEVLASISYMYHPQDKKNTRQGIYIFYPWLQIHTKNGLDHRAVYATGEEETGMLETHNKNRDMRLIGVGSACRNSQKEQQTGQ